MSKTNKIEQEKQKLNDTNRIKNKTNQNWARQTKLNGTNKNWMRRSKTEWYKQNNIVYISRLLFETGPSDNCKILTKQNCTKIRHRSCLQTDSVSSRMLGSKYEWFFSAEILLANYSSGAHWEVYQPILSLNLLKN